MRHLFNSFTGQPAIGNIFSNVQHKFDIIKYRIIPFIVENSQVRHSLTCLGIGHFMELQRAGGTCSILLSMPPKLWIVVARSRAPVPPRFTHACRLPAPTHGCHKMLNINLWRTTRLWHTKRATSAGLLVVRRRRSSAGRGTLAKWSRFDYRHNSADFPHCGVWVFTVRRLPFVAPKCDTITRRYGDCDSICFALWNGSNIIWR